MQECILDRVITIERHILEQQEKHPEAAGLLTSLLYDRAASDGTQAILDIEPQDLHQHTPLFIGNRRLVDLAEEFVRRPMPQAGRGVRPPGLGIPAWLCFWPSAAY